MHRQCCKPLGGVHPSLSFRCKTDDFCRNGKTRHDFWEGTSPGLGELKEEASTPNSYFLVLPSFAAELFFAAVFFARAPFRPAPLPVAGSCTRAARVASKIINTVRAVGLFTGLSVIATLPLNPTD